MIQGKVVIEKGYDGNPSNLCRLNFGKHLWGIMPFKTTGQAGASMGIPLLDFWPVEQRRSAQSTLSIDHVPGEKTHVVSLFFGHFSWFADMQPSTRAAAQLRVGFLLVLGSSGKGVPSPRPGPVTMSSGKDTLSHRRMYQLHASRSFGSLKHHRQQHLQHLFTQQDFIVETSETHRVSNTTSLCPPARFISPEPLSSCSFGLPSSIWTRHARDITAEFWVVAIISYWNFSQLSMLQQKKIGPYPTNSCRMVQALFLRWCYWQCLIS